MAAYTSTQSGAYSDAATWGGGGTPTVNGDTFIVSAGHTVTFDADLSGLASGLGASTINGTLIASTTSGAYFLKMAGDLVIGAGGTLQAGTSRAVPYPIGCTFKIFMNGGFRIHFNSATSSCKLFCTQPTTRWTRLAGAESASATVLEVITDLTGDTLWAVGATIRINDVNGLDTEKRIIQSVSSTAITITAGITNAKIQDALVILCTRNVEVYGLGTAGSTMLIRHLGPATSILDAHLHDTLLGGAPLQAITPLTVGSVIESINGNAMDSSNSVIFDGVLAQSGSTSNNSFALVYETGSLVSGQGSVGMARASIVKGTIAGNAGGVSMQGGVILGASIWGNATGLNGIHASIRNTSFGTPRPNVAGDINAAAGGGGFLFVEGYNVTLSSSTQVYNYLNTYSNPSQRVVLRDIAGVDGTWRWWNAGGKGVSVTTPTITGWSGTYVQNFIFESAGNVNFLDIPMWSEPSGLTIKVYCKKDTNSMTETPRAQIVIPEDDPIYGGSAVAESIMTDDTTDQVLTLTYTPAYPREVILRIRGIHGSGNLYAAWERIAAGGGIAVLTGGGLVR